jgi:hypothetical protein
MTWSIGSTVQIIDAWNGIVARVSVNHALVVDGRSSAESAATRDRAIVLAKKERFFKGFVDIRYLL